MSEELFIRIYDWMFDILKGNDLIVYALIYSLGEVTGQRYIVERTRIPVENVCRSLKKLEEKKLIVSDSRGTNNLTTWRIDETSKPLLTKHQNRIDETSKPTCQNVKTELTKRQNPLYINTNIDTNRNTNTNTNHQVIAVVLSSLSVESDDESMRSLCTSIDGFIEHRKKLKKPMTEHALELSIKRAHQLSNGDVKGMTELFDLAVEKGWQGIYPSKDKKEGEKNDTGKHERFFK